MLRDSDEQQTSSLTIFYSTAVTAKQDLVLSNLQTAVTLFMYLRAQRTATGS